MKEGHQQPVYHHSKRSSLPAVSILIRICNTPAAYVVFLLLFYALGYLSAPNSCTSPPPPLFTPLTLPETPPTTSVDQLPTQLDNFRVSTRCNDPLPHKLVRQTILDRLFDSTSPYSNFPLGDAMKKRVRGWGSYGPVFQHLIEQVKPKVIIEVGTFLGASALHMANLTRQLGLDTQILCVDDFRGWPGFRDRFKYIKVENGDVSLLRQFMHNVIYYKAMESVLPIPFSSGSAMETLCQWGVYGDLIEIDAGHDFNSAWADINRAYRILSPGGVIFGHDYFTMADNRGVRRAVNLFAQLNGLKIQIHGQHWVIRPS